MANTFKVTTFIFILLALFVPVWPISGPFFGYCAWLSYKSEK